MDRPIMRWTIGDVSEDGFKCLRQSVGVFLKFYGEDFEYYVCHNSIDPKRLNWAREMGVELIDQNSFKESLSIPPIASHPCWKLYPPCIKPGRYQIFVDNDLLIHKPLDLLSFVRQDRAFITEAIKKGCNGTFQAAEDTKLNSGFFGVPKNFDFVHSLNEAIGTYNVQWNSSYFEEQGLVGFILQSIGYELIELSEISVCLPEWCRPDWISPYSIGTHGIHFVGLNRGPSIFWRRYSAKML